MSAGSAGDLQQAVVAVDLPGADRLSSPQFALPSGSELGGTRCYVAWGVARRGLLFWLCPVRQDVRTVFFPEDLEIDSLQDDGSVFSVRGTDGDYTPNYVKRFLKL